MGNITTHVLDTSRGKPAAGMSVVLEKQSADGNWQLLGRGQTGEGGRVRDGLAPAGGVAEGIYRLRFDTGAYFQAQRLEGFFPEVVVEFTVRDGTEHHHVPLLLSPWSYSTYRGS